MKKIGSLLLSYPYFQKEFRVSCARLTNFEMRLLSFQILKFLIEENVLLKQNYPSLKSSKNHLLVKQIEE